MTNEDESERTIDTGGGDAVDARKSQGVLIKPSGPVYQIFGDVTIQMADSAPKAAKQDWSEFDWQEAAKRYLERMGRRYSTLRILGSPCPAKLEDVFTDVYILDKPTALRRFDIRQLREDPSRLEGSERTSGLQLVTQENILRLFVLGKPGAGKTTFLKYLTLQVVQGKIDRIPIFVTLREWSDSGLDLVSFIVKQFDTCAFPNPAPFIEHVLSQGRAMVLFDGLDEVNMAGDRRRQTIDGLVAFSHKYLDSQCLVTCRMAATDYSFEQFTYVEIADFTDDQMRDYVYKWFQDDPVKRDIFLEEFEKQENRGLREIGRIPLLLSLLCLALAETMRFPRHQAEIYEEAIDALLKRWDRSRNIGRDEAYRELSLGRKRQMLARIAAETMEAGEYFIRQENLENRIVHYLQELSQANIDEDIDGEAILKAIEAQHGILIERAHRIYSFAHLTFQEYFAAKYVVDSASERLFRRLFRDHLTDDRWREVILLIASMLNNADLFFAAFLVAIGDLVRGDKVIVRLLQWAENKAATSSQLYRRSFVRALNLASHLDFALACAGALANTIDRALDYALDHADVLADTIASASAIANAIDCGSAITSALDFTGNLARVRPLDLVSARALTRALASARGLAIDRVSGLNSALEGALAIDHELSVAIDRDLASNLERVSASARALDRVSALDINVEVSLSGAVERASARDLVSARDLAYSADFDAFLLGVSSRIYYIVGYGGGGRNTSSLISLWLEVAAERSRVLGLDDLGWSLAQLQVPPGNAPVREWLELAETLRETLVTFRDIGHDWNLDTERVERIQSYLQANCLLVECLELAHVSDREEILDGLLLPPQPDT
jgi:hypothetical protein